MSSFVKASLSKSQQTEARWRSCSVRPCPLLLYKDEGVPGKRGADRLGSGACARPRSAHLEGPPTGTPSWRLLPSLPAVMAPPKCSSVGSCPMTPGTGGLPGCQLFPARALGPGPRAPSCFLRVSLLPPSRTGPRRLAVGLPVLVSPWWPLCPARTPRLPRFCVSALGAQSAAALALGPTWGRGPPPTARPKPTDLTEALTRVQPGPGRPLLCP